MWQKLARLDTATKVVFAVIALPGVLFGALAIIGAFTEEWASYCGASQSSPQRYADLPACYAAALMQQKVTGAMCGCRRSDWPMGAQDRVWEVLRKVTGRERPET